MKILLTGSKGQLGKELLKQFSVLEKIEYRMFPVDLEELDITDAEAVESFFNISNPDIVINCAAYTNVDLCESNESIAYKINALGAKNLAIASFDRGIPIVHISTDYVFDGLSNKSLREDAMTNPINLYGKSKLLGENFVVKSNPRHFILRTAWLYGDGKNFIKSIIEKAKKDGHLRVVDDQFGTPTSTVDLAKCILTLIKTKHFGLYHATCQGECSWYDFAIKILEYGNIDVKIDKISSSELNLPAQRPKYSVLDNFMLNLIGKNNFKDWEESLCEYLKGMNTL